MIDCASVVCQKWLTLNMRVQDRYFTDRQSNCLSLMTQSRWMSSSSQLASTVSTARTDWQADLHAMRQKVPLLPWYFFPPLLMRNRRWTSANVAEDDNKTTRNERRMRDTRVDSMDRMLSNCLCSKLISCSQSRETGLCGRCRIWCRREKLRSLWARHVRGDDWSTLETQQSRDRKFKSKYNDGKCGVNCALPCRTVDYNRT